MIMKSNRSGPLKHTIRDACVVLFSVTGAAYLYRRRIAKKSPLVRIVVFHDVPDRAWFEETVGMLTRFFHVISPSDFNTNRLSQEKINILLTFDDGYKSWVDVALPVLKKHSIKALFFLTSGLLDVTGNPEVEQKFIKKRLHLKYRKPLSWADAKVLLEDGHTVGGHAKKHEHLARVRPDRAVRSIKEDKEAIESKLGVTLTDFAYPFGTKRHVNNEVMNLVREAGYTRAYTAISRFVSENDGFLIPRMCIEKDMPQRRLRRWIMGSYDLFDICVR